MAAYEPVTWREWFKNRSARKGMVAFRDGVLFWARPRGVFDLGIYNRRNIRGSGIRSLHSVGRAWDVGGVNATDPNNFGHELALRFILASELCGITEVIWNKHRWTSAAGTVEYHGVDDHTTHIHVGFTVAFADNPSSHDELVKWSSVAVYSNR